VRKARKAAHEQPRRKAVARSAYKSDMEIEPLRRTLTPAEKLLKACKEHFPAELHAQARDWIREMFLGTAKSARKTFGRPPGGIGSQVDVLINRQGFDQTAARQLVADGLCECANRSGPCMCGAYERVSTTHKQWKRDQRRSKSGGQTIR